MKCVICVCLAIFFMATVSCSEQNAGATKYDIGAVDILRASNLRFFGENAECHYRKDALGGVFFKIQPGYVGGGQISTRERGVGIAIFGSRESALAACEARRNGVSNVICKGTEEREHISIWWYCESQALLSLVVGNMVVEVSDVTHRYFEVEQELWNTAMEFIRMAEPCAALDTSSLS